MNLTVALNAQRDRYAKAQGAFVLGTSIVRMAQDSLWEFLRGLGSTTFRVVYRCKDGTVRDMLGRQGVHTSQQDGTVRNVGAPMAKAGERISFWTLAYGSKVNTGAGKGYRTLRIEGILAVRVNGVDVLTDNGMKELASR